MESLLDLTIEGAVARITMHGRPVNSLSPAFTETFDAALDKVGASSCSVLHIASTLKVFSAGGDLETISQCLGQEDASQLFGDYVRQAQSLFNKLADLPQVSVAEIAGAALGGGLELALACDFRIASRSARIGLPEVGLGLLPAAGGTQRLVMLCGRAVANRIVLAAEPVDGATAEALGIVQWAVEPEAVRTKTAELIARLAAAPPEGLAAAKRCIAAAAKIPPERFALEVDEIVRLATGPRTLDLVSAFLKR